MISKSEAQKIFEDHVKADKFKSEGVELSIELEDEKDYGWIFTYQSKQYLESGDILDALMGNHPCLVAKKDGSVWPLGAGAPREMHLAEFEKHGTIDYEKVWKEYAQARE